MRKASITEKVRAVVQRGQESSLCLTLLQEGYRRGRFFEKYNPFSPSAYAFGLNAFVFRGSKAFCLEFADFKRAFGKNGAGKNCVFPAPKVDLRRFELRSKQVTTRLSTRLFCLIVFEKSRRGRRPVFSLSS